MRWCTALVEPASRACSIYRGWMATVDRKSLTLLSTFAGPLDPLKTPADNALIDEDEALFMRHGEESRLVGSLVDNSISMRDNPVAVQSFRVMGGDATYLPGSGRYYFKTGSIVIRANGSYDFVPNPDFFGLFTVRRRAAAAVDV